MAATSAPVPAYPDDPSRRGNRPNVASADVRLPAVRSYEQVDREIRATLHPSLGWFALLGVAILCMLIGASTWTYQIYEGLGAADVAAVAHGDAAHLANDVVRGPTFRLVDYDYSVQTCPFAAESRAPSRGADVAECEIAVPVEWVQQGKQQRRRRQ